MRKSSGPKLGNNNIPPLLARMETLAGSAPTATVIVRIAIDAMAFENIGFSKTILREGGVYSSLPWRA